MPLILKIGETWSFDMEAFVMSKDGPTGISVTFSLSGDDAQAMRKWLRQHARRPKRKPPTDGPTSS